MASFRENDSIAQFQKFVESVYGLPDDRLYSIWDLLTQQQRFTMRALKGIRKGSIENLKLNLLIAFSWLMAAANRLHIDLEGETWKRFPYLCSYCGKAPCVCKSTKPKERYKLEIGESKRPNSLADFQAMFEKIYPAGSRSLPDAGVHLAEEMGEVSEAIHNYLGEHKGEQFDEIAVEMADFVSCIMGVANSALIDMAGELSVMYKNNCHICHQAPCGCSFTQVVTLKT